MLDDARAFVAPRIGSVYQAIRSFVIGIKPAFVSKQPHFSFITAHYFWIIGATIVASVLIYAPGKGSVAYIDALMFASGANTQAGLNPVDVNLLNTFQQVIIYIFVSLSNPITLHGSVVFLRLYWFEKRFQGWVRDARLRRGTMSKSKSKARYEGRQAEEGGVQGRHITVVPHHGQAPRITNDGILLDAVDGVSPKSPVGDSGESDSSTMAGERSHGIKLARLDQQEDRPSGSEGRQSETEEHQDPDMKDISEMTSSHGITFADTVKRSDGVYDELTNFQQHRNAEHIAILERQRNHNDEVLRIPGPRDAERGLGPRPLGEQDENDDSEYLARARTREPTTENMTRASAEVPNRHPTITIAEPEHRRRDDIVDDATAAGRTLESLRFRKPRILNRGQKKLHEDDPNLGDEYDASHENGNAIAAQPSRTRTLDTIRTYLSREKGVEDTPYLSYTPTMGRNSNFVGLSLEQREELGGIEYRSLRTLALILLGYYWGFELLAATFLLPYIFTNDKHGRIVEGDGIGRPWWGLWTSHMSFMDVGFTLTPDSMSSFVTQELPLMVMWFFIIIGNTGFPVMLRFVIWVLAQIVPRGTGLWEELRFLLDHPRRCFTLLFPSGANWWLFWILFVLNGVDLLFFIVLDLHSSPVSDLPVHNRIVVGLFQAASTRTAGFSAVSISQLHPAMPVLYMIMMYISVFPIAISIRRTNVYEEKSLGFYGYDKKDDDMPGADASAFSYVGIHLRRQLSFDLWYVFLGFFVVAISEGDKIMSGRFNLFDVLFEIVSAYGTVGLSMGVPGVNASLCSQFNVVGKLVIVAMQIRGRHRGLPYGLDRAVLLPSEARFERETQEALPIIPRTNTMASATGPGGPIRRGSTAGRSRSASRERERNIITSFLHPGPSVPYHHRSKSTETQLGPSLIKRVRTEPAVEDDDDVEEMPRNPRRMESMPAGS